LPDWLKFDSVSGTFSGMPPGGNPAVVDVVVIARDAESREARVNFTLELGVPGADSAPATAPVASVPRPLDAGTGLVDRQVSPGETPAAAAPGALLDASAGLKTLPSTPGSAGRLAADAQAAGAAPGAQSSAISEATDKPFAAAESAKAISAAAFARLDAENRGFQLARISEAETSRVAAAEGDITGGHRLFIYHGIKEARGANEFTVPRDAFAHTDPASVVHLEAQLADGGSLPSWLSFDALTGSFRGVAPDGRAIIDVLITAHDDEGREASIIIRLDLGEKDDVTGARSAIETEDRASTAGASSDDLASRRVAADEDTADSVDDSGGEAASLQAEKQPAKRSALPFSEQIKAARVTRDPVLAKILGESGKPTKRTPA